MDLFQLLSRTIHPDQATRQAAEASLRAIEGERGVVLAVFEIVASEAAPFAVRQAGSIWFKNRIARSWKRRKDGGGEEAGTGEDGGNVSQMTEEDREAIKARFLSVLVESPPLIGKQILTALGTILSQDYPEHWPGVLEGMVHMIATDGDPKIRLTGLEALSVLVGRYRWASNDTRKPLDEIILKAFPTLVMVGSRLLAKTNVDDSDARALMVMFKIYKHAVAQELSTHLALDEALVPWGTLFLQTAGKEISLAALPQEAEERDRCPWAKAKKRAHYNLNRLFKRYGNPAGLANSNREQYMPFARGFTDRFVPQILHSYFAELEGWIAGRWLAHTSLILILDLFAECVKPKVTWQLLKPHLEVLVSRVIFPLLCFSDADSELWEEDPVEYIHKRVDVIEDYSTIAVSASNLLMSFASNRPKMTFMPCLEFANSVLSRYPREVGPREKDGALRMIAGLSEQCQKKESKVIGMMEGFLVAHVIPECQSEHAFLRARACELLMRFDEIVWTSDENLINAFQGIMRCLQDTQLPVKAAAALAIGSLTPHEIVRKAMGPAIPQVMQTLLALTNEVDLDTLSEVMDSLVEQFDQEIRPFAVQLSQQLRDSYLRLVHEQITGRGKNASQGDEDEAVLDLADEKVMAALGVLKTLTTIICSLESSSDIIQAMDSAVAPIVILTLENQMAEFYDEVFEISDAVLYSAKKVSPAMWRVFELTYSVFKDHAFDMLDSMLPTLDNFISFGNQVISQNADYQKAIFDIVQTVLKSDEMALTEKAQACKLAESVMLNCRGSVDGLVPSFLDLAQPYFIDESKIESRAFRVSMLEFVLNTVLYQPGLALSYLANQGWLTIFLTVWFKTLNDFARVHDKKLCIAAISAVLRSDSASLPTEVQGGLGMLFQGLLKMYETLPEALESESLS